MLSKNVFLLAGLVCVSACSSVLGSNGVKDITGKVRFYSIEGGFYAIRGNDSVTYDPTNLAKIYNVDGLRVQARVRIRKDLTSFHMVGQIVDILELKALDPIGPVALDRISGR